MEFSKEFVAGITKFAEEAELGDKTDEFTAIVKTAVEQLAVEVAKIDVTEFQKKAADADMSPIETWLLAQAA